jgi:flagellar hook-length control protein FliK
MPGAPQPPPLFEQVAMRMTPLSDGAHDVEIRLVPEHLGKLRIELHIDSGRVDASVQADNSEARALLLREEPSLREALRSAGVTLSSFNVALSGEPWKEKRGGTQPNGDADSAPHRGGKEERVEGAARVHGVDADPDGMNRTEHWIA